jgi:hypothetical protein
VHPRQSFCTSSSQVPKPENRVIKFLGRIGTYYAIGIIGLPVAGFVGLSTWWVSSTVKKSIAPVIQQVQGLQTDLKNGLSDLQKTFSTDLQIHTGEDEIKHLKTKLHVEERFSKESLSAWNSRIVQIEEEIKTLKEHTKAIDSESKQA